MNAKTNTIMRNKEIEIMANQLDEVSIRGLRITHFEQLESYLIDNEQEGCYYGNKKQYNKRHAELKEWLANIIKQARDKNNTIPK